jgi:hypothetical protein
MMERDRLFDCFAVCLVLGYDGLFIDVLGLSSWFAVR